MMIRSDAPRSRRAAICASVAALALTAAPQVSAAASDGGPVVRTANGAVRGLTVADGFSFRGLPYAAAPVGWLRWRPPHRPASWDGVRDATQFAASCPQAPSPFAPPGITSEDCLYLNVSTSTLRRRAHRPVLVWIHGGGLTQDAGRDYDATALAAEGIVVVTINYRLGALGFLAHPALASRPGGSAGNYGLMDQQAALRWIRHNIRRFGGNPHNVTIAGESAGGLSVLAHMTSGGSRWLFQRAIVESGAFALNQQSLADAEAFGETFAAKAGCPDQTAACLRSLPVADLVNNFPGAAIPGVIDGRVLKRSIAAAFASNRFAHVPLLNGVNHDEESIFVSIGAAVSGGTFVPVPEPVTPASYETAIAAVLGVPAARASAIASEYPLGAYATPNDALSTLVSDANFACPALQVDRWSSRRAPTFAYQFDDDTAPQLFVPPGIVPAVATHASEMQYLFDLPNAPFPTALDGSQQALAAAMRAAWANFAASGDPSSPVVAWPSFNGTGASVSLRAPLPQVVTNFDNAHHCGFWAAA
jgi:para-nitrobenzyl esterase